MLRLATWLPHTTCATLCGLTNGLASDLFADPRATGDSLTGPHIGTMDLEVQRQEGFCGRQAQIGSICQIKAATGLVQQQTWDAATGDMPVVTEAGSNMWSEDHTRSSGLQIDQQEFSFKLTQLHETTPPYPISAMPKQDHISTFQHYITY